MRRKIADQLKDLLEEDERMIAQLECVDDAFAPDIPPPPKKRSFSRVEEIMAAAAEEQARQPTQFEVDSQELVIDDEQENDCGVPTPTFPPLKRFAKLKEVARAVLK